MKKNLRVAPNDLNSQTIQIIQLESKRAAEICTLINEAYSEIQQIFFGDLPRTDIEQVMSVFKTGLWIGACDESDMLVGVAALEVKSTVRFLLSNLSVLPRARSAGIGDALESEALLISQKRDAKFLEQLVVGRKHGECLYSQKLRQKAIKNNYCFIKKSDFESVYPARSDSQRLPLIVYFFELAI